MYLLEGPNLIGEALKNQVLPEFLLVDEGDSQGEEIRQLCSDYETRLAEAGKLYAGEKVLVLESSLFRRLAQTENSQGIAGVVRQPSWSEEAFFQKRRGSGNILVLDRLQDPGNVGTMIRTADAAGYEGILVLKGTVDIFSPKVVRSCTGSLFRMPILFGESPEGALALLRRQGKRVISTGFQTETYYYDVDLKSDVALVLGNEGNGICETFKQQSDQLVKIPMWGSVESLNAAAAAAVLMYEAMRK